MHSLLLSSFASLALATSPNLLFERQDYTVRPGQEVQCSPQYKCGIYCLDTSHFCCLDKSHPCKNGEYCLGTNGCCYNNEDISACAARNGIAIPASYTSNPPTTPPAPPVSASNPVPSTSLPVVSASNPILTTSVPVVSASLPTLSTTIPTATPSYPIGNATLPAPTGTGVKPSGATFTGGAERLGQAGGLVLGLVGMIAGVLV